MEAAINNKFKPINAEDLNCTENEFNDFLIDCHLMMTGKFPQENTNPQKYYAVNLRTGETYEVETPMQVTVSIQSPNA